MPDAQHTSRCVAEQFDDLDQQTSASRLGMWLFLATEVLFFGGLFAAYTAYRHSYPQAFAAASHELSVAFGALDTAVLLGSSFTMVLSIHAIQTGGRRAAVQLLLATGALGALFLVLHGYEYYKDYVEHHFPGSGFHFEGANEGNAEMFFVIYFILTGLHSLHVFIGVVVMGVMAWRAHLRRFSPEYHTPVEIAGLYWHFVDLVWVFLFPLLYLISHH